VSYRPHLESGALRQMHGLPEHASDMLVTLLARICDDPYDPGAGACRYQLARASVSLPAWRNWTAHWP
jgi:hypothetical protein